MTDPTSPDTTASLESTPMAAVTLTQAAVDRIKELSTAREQPTAGLRIYIRTKGCSGLSYAMEFANEVPDGDDIIEQDGVKIFLDPKALLFIIGTEIDFISDNVQSGFTFRNPTQKSHCGCGKSFCA